MAQYSILSTPDGYTPHKWQAKVKKAFETATSACCVVPRQHGKTELATYDVAEFATTTSRHSPVIAIIADSINQTMNIYWDRLNNVFSDKFTELYIDTSKAPTPTITIRRPYRDYEDNEGNKYKDFAKIMFFGAENGKAIEGQALDYALIDELGLWPVGVFTKSVKPALSYKEGICRILGTPNGDNDLYSTLTGHLKSESPTKFAYHKNVYEIGLWSKEKISRVKQEYIEEGKLPNFNQSFMCDFFANVRGAVFAGAISEAREENRILPQLGYYPGLPIYSVWDIGLSYTACWFFQYNSGMYNMIEAYEWKDTTLEEIMKDFNPNQYEFAQHFLPHDAFHKSPTDGSTYADSFIILSKGNGSVVKIPKIGEEEIRTRTAKSMFKFVNFNEQGCKEGLALLGQYTVQHDSKTGFLKNKIVKNRASHTGDAFCQMFMIPKNSLLHGFAQPPENNYIRDMLMGKAQKRKFKPGLVSRYGERHLYKRRKF